MALLTRPPPAVDPATVVRFAQELEYSGYRELSREIKHYVRDQVTSTYRKAGEATSRNFRKAGLNSSKPNMSKMGPNSQKIGTTAPGVCRSAKARGNLLQDAWFAALAIETGCEWITTDRDYARFDGLNWRAPF